MTPPPRDGHECSSAPRDSTQGTCSACMHRRSCCPKAARHRRPGRAKDGPGAAGASQAGSRLHETRNQSCVSVARPAPCPLHCNCVRPPRTFYYRAASVESLQARHIYPEHQRKSEQSALHPGLARSGKKGSGSSKRLSMTSSALPSRSAEIMRYSQARCCTSWSWCPTCARRAAVT